MDLFNLAAKFTADTSQFVQSVNQARGVMGQGVDAANKLDATLGKLKTAFAAVVSVAGIVKVGQAVKGLADSVSAAGDRIDKNSQALGMSRRAYQQWDYILRQSGSSIDTMGTSMKTLNSAILNGGDGTITALNTLGLNLEQLQGMSQEDQFEAMVRAFQEMPAGATKSALALQLFGKNGQSLMPLLNSSADSIDEMRGAAERMGIVMSDSMIDNAVAYGDAFDNMSATFGGLKNIIGSGLLEPMTGIFDTITAFFSQQDVQDAAKRFATNLHTIGNVVLDGVQSFFQFLNDNKDTIGTALSNIAEFLGDIGTTVGGFAIETLKEIAGAFTDFIENADPAQIAALGALAFVIGLCIAPVQTLGAAALLLAANWKSVKKWAAEAATALQDWTDAKMNDAKQGLQNLADKVKPVEENFESTRVKIRDTALAIADFFTTGELPEDAPDWIKTPVNAVKGLWDGVTGAVSAVTTAMTDFFTTGELPEGTPDWIRIPVEAVKGVWDSITAAVGAVTDKITAFFDGGELNPDLPEWVQTVLYVIRDAWQAIVTTAVNAKNKVAAFFGSVFGSPAWLGIVNGIKTAIDGIRTAAEQALQAIQNLFAGAGGGGGVTVPTDGGYSGLTSGDIGTRVQTWNDLESLWNGNAAGLDYVPRNGYRSLLHEGEAVLTKQEAEVWRKGGLSRGASAGDIAAAVANALEGMALMMDGEHVGRLTAKSVSREMQRSARAGRFATA